MTSSGPDGPERDERRLSLADFPVHQVVTIRWRDNDMYGHVNNAVYYEFFDAAISTWLSEVQGMSIGEGDVISVVAESGCRFLRSVSFPGEVTVGMGVTRVGTSSVTYQLAVFDGLDPDRDASPCAVGHWVEVYVDRASGATTAIPDTVRAAMESVLRGAA